MSNVNKYKLLAEQCLELAEQAENGPQERAALREIAWRFAKLAYKAYFSQQSLDKPTALSRLQPITIEQCAGASVARPAPLIVRYCVSLR